MVPHSPVHAWSRANFIKHASQLPKFCTEAEDSVLKPEHTIGSCRSSPEVRSQRSPWFSHPAIAASPGCKVPYCTPKLSSDIWHSIGLTWILNICRLSNWPFLNLGATCFRIEWQTSTNFRRLLLQDSPSSQPPRLPKFNFSTALPTSVPTTVYLPVSRFCHTFCTLGFKRILKFVDILSSGRETSWQDCSSQLIPDFQYRHRTVQDSTSLRYSDMGSCTGTGWYKTVQVGTRLLITTVWFHYWLAYIGTYQYTAVHTGMNQYIQYIPVSCHLVPPCTAVYWLVLFLVPEC